MGPPGSYPLRGQWDEAALNTPIAKWELDPDVMVNSMDVFAETELKDVQVYMLTRFAGSFALVAAGGVAVLSTVLESLAPEAVITKKESVSSNSRSSTTAPTAKSSTVSSLTPAEEACTDPTHTAEGSGP